MSANHPKPPRRLLWLITVGVLLVVLLLVGTSVAVNYVTRPPGGRFVDRLPVWLQRWLGVPIRDLEPIWDRDVADPPTKVDE